MLACNLCCSNVIYVSKGKSHELMPHPPHAWVIQASLLYRRSVVSLGHRHAQETGGWGLQPPPQMLATFAKINGNWAELHLKSCAKIL